MSSMTQGKFPMLSSLIDPSFGIPTDVTFHIMGLDSPEDGDSKQEILLKEIKGHKLLLGLFSEVFKRGFYGPAKETKDVVPVKETTVEAFEKMFDYIYRKDIKWGDLSLLEMFDIANLAEKYDIPSLMEEVKAQIEMIPLTTTEDVMDAAHTATQFYQFPAISSALLLSCAKLVKTTLKTSAQLLQFSTDQSVDGQETMVLQLLAMVKDLPPLNCSNCGEEECKDRQPVISRDKVTQGCKLTINTQSRFWSTAALAGKVFIVVSVNQQEQRGTVKHPNNNTFEHSMYYCNMPVYCYKCD
eukprot:GFUD01034544.1.p1 GENE.GFUD01034544.1~~GFUD01034544.1.p1  ORF type:complete len:299 (-),score=76.61 GFUD01034544.1:11-907(-)